MPETDTWPDVLMRFSRVDTVDPLLLDRAHGALMGLAIGDALGMPSQTLTIDQILHHYGRITDFVAPFDDHPVSHGLQAAQVTDDTEQALLLAERLIDGAGKIDQKQFARDLLSWEADIKARGLRDLLGPSSKAALEALLSGVPIEKTGRNGTTNGAAMRIAPVGIAVPIDPLPRFVDHVENACRLSHNTGEAIAAAAATAAMISCALDGVSLEDALILAQQAAQEGQKRGHSVGDPDMAARIATALQIAETSGSEEKLAAEIGTSVASRESIATAFGLVRLAKGDPWQAALMAANIGDDTDTIGAIAGAMTGAFAGFSAIPAAAVAKIEDVNDLPLRETAKALLGLRGKSGADFALTEAKT